MFSRFVKRFLPIFLPVLFLFVASSYGDVSGLGAASVSINIVPLVTSDTLHSINGALTLSTDLSVGGNAAVTGTLGVTGAGTFDSTLSAADMITASKGVSASTITVSGATVLNGAMTLGDAASDTATFNAYTVFASSSIYNAALGLYTRTSAQLKISTPSRVGQEWFDTTLKQPVYSSGTSTCRDYVTSTGTIPSGY